MSSWITALGALRVGEATALGDALATAVEVARGTPQAATRPAGEKPPPAVDPRPLGRRASTAGAFQLGEAIRRAREAKVPVFTALLGTEAGVVQVPHVGGYVERIQVPPDPARSAPRRHADGRELLPGADARTTSARSTPT